MIKPHLTLAVALSLAFAGLGVRVAAAQDAPPQPDATPRCGGLLCDMGMFQGPGGRDPAFGPEPTCGFFCRVTGGGPAADAAASQQAQAQAQAQQAAAEPVEKPHHKPKRKHVAKAAMPKAAPATAAAEPAPAAK